MAIKRNSGTQVSAKKIILYGCEGGGKTTLASQFPDPHFIDLEGSSIWYNVSRTEGIETYDEVIQEIDYILQTRNCKTLVIDTVDRVEELATKSIRDRNGGKPLNACEGGYGAGYRELTDTFLRLLIKLDEVIKVNINVVLVAHSLADSVTLPGEQPYTKWRINLDEKYVMPKVKNWADVICFINFERMIVDGQAVSDERMMYFEHSPIYDAKNRFGLPARTQLSYAPFEKLFSGEAKENPKQALFNRFTALLEENGISIEQYNNYSVSRSKLSLNEDSAEHINAMIQNIGLLVKEIKKEGK